MSTTWQGFLPVGQHVAPQQIDIDTLEAAPLLSVRQNARGALGQIGVQQCHGRVREP
jgi:hypothetical protein